jgi:hypothetical protein
VIGMMVPLTRRIAPPRATPSPATQRTEAFFLFVVVVQEEKKKKKRKRKRKNQNFDFTTIAIVDLYHNTITINI